MLKENKKSILSNCFWKKISIALLTSVVILSLLIFSLSSCASNSSALHNGGSQGNEPAQSTAGSDGEAVEVPKAESLHSSLSLSQYVSELRSKPLAEQIRVLFGNSSSITTADVYNLEIVDSDSVLAQNRPGFRVKVVLARGYIFRNSNNVENCTILPSKNTCEYFISYNQLLTWDDFQNAIFGAYYLKPAKDYQSYFHDLTLIQKLTLINSPLLNESIVKTIEIKNVNSAYGYEITLNAGLQFSIPTHTSNSHFFEFNKLVGKPGLDLGETSRLIPPPTVDESSRLAITSNLSISDYVTKNFGVFDKQNSVTMTGPVKINQTINFFRTLTGSNWHQLYGLSSAQINKINIAFSVANSVLSFQFSLSNGGYHFQGDLSTWTTQINYSQVITNVSENFYKAVLLANQQSGSDFVRNFNNLKLSEKFVYLSKDPNAMTIVKDVSSSIDASDSSLIDFKLTLNKGYSISDAANDHGINEYIFKVSLLPFATWSQVISEYVNPQMRVYSTAELSNSKIRNLSINDWTFTKLNSDLWHIDFSSLDKQFSHRFNSLLILENFDLTSANSLVFSVGFDAYTNNFLENKNLLSSKICSFSGINSFSAVFKSLDNYTATTSIISKLVDQVLELLLTGSLNPDKPVLLENNVPTINFKTILKSVGPTITDLIFRTSPLALAKVLTLLSPINPKIDMHTLIRCFNDIFANKPLTCVLSEIGVGSQNNEVAEMDAFSFIASVPALAQNTLRYVLVTSPASRLLNSLPSYAIVNQSMELVVNQLALLTQQVIDNVTNDPMLVELVLKNSDPNIGVLDELDGIASIALNGLIIDPISPDPSYIKTLEDINGVLYPSVSSISAKNDPKANIGFDLNACIYRNVANSTTFLNSLMYGIQNIVSGGSVVDRFLHLSTPPPSTISFVVNDIKLKALKRLGFFFAIDPINRELQFTYDSVNKTVEVKFVGAKNVVFVLENSNLQSDYWLGSNSYNGGLFNINVYDLLGNVKLCEDVLTFAQYVNPKEKDVFVEIKNCFVHMNITPQSLFDLLNSVVIPFEEGDIHNSQKWFFAQSITDPKNAIISLRYNTSLKQLDYARTYPLIPVSFNSSIQISLKPLKTFLKDLTLGDLLNLLKSLGVIGELPSGVVDWIGGVKLAPCLCDSYTVPNNLSFSQDILFTSSDIVATLQSINATAVTSLVGMNALFDTLLGLNVSGRNKSGSHIYHVKFGFLSVDSIIESWLEKELTVDGKGNEYVFDVVQKPLVISYINN